jgi:hypothetical protein
MTMGAQYGTALEKALYGTALEGALYGGNPVFTDSSNANGDGSYIDQSNIFVDLTPVEGGVGILYYLQQV